MLHACATSSNDRPSIEADPLIETRTVVRTVCPAEITAALPPRPQPAGDAVITGNETGMAWLSDTLIHLGLVEGRIRDAKEQCPQ
jgi:hypothetical protein